MPMSGPSEAGPGGAEARLAGLGIVLPAAVAPVANYVPAVLSGRLLSVSGQLPMQDGVLAAVGRLGEGVGVEEGHAAARLCLIGVLAQLRAACGSLDRVSRVVRLGGFIAATAEFTAHAQVMNGASDLAVAVFGERGRHARSTVGVSSLPLGAAVEVEGLFEVEA